MPYALHETDEETDVSAYRAYLGAQTDADLLDIVGHMDPDRYPARLDAARRELRRRRVLHLPVYTPTEYAIRYLALASLALSALTLALTWLLTPEDAAAPPWPQDIPEGTPATLVARMFLVALLRGAVVTSVHMALYPLALLALAHWTLSRLAPLCRHRARADVWRLAALAAATLILAIFTATAPASAVPTLFTSHDNWPPPTTLLDPFN